MSLLATIAQSKTLVVEMRNASQEMRILADADLQPMWAQVAHLEDRTDPTPGWRYIGSVTHAGREYHAVTHPAHPDVDRVYLLIPGVDLLANSRHSYPPVDASS